MQVSRCSETERDLGLESTYRSIIVLEGRRALTVVEVFRIVGIFSSRPGLLAKSLLADAQVRAAHGTEVVRHVCLAELSPELCPPAIAASPSPQHTHTDTHTPTHTHTHRHTHIHTSQALCSSYVTLNPPPTDQHRAPGWMPCAPSVPRALKVNKPSGSFCPPAPEKV